MQVAEGAAREANVEIIYPDVPALAPFQELAQFGVELTPLDPELVRDSAVTLTRQLREHIRTRRPNVVHVTDTWPPGIVAARLAGVRRLLLTHHTPTLPRTDSLAGRAWWQASWLARPETIYTSQTDLADDRRRLLRRHVVELGIDLGRFSSEQAVRAHDGAAPVIGTVARLAQQKGLDVLIDAFPAVVSEWPQASLVICGEGEERAALEARAARLGIADRVRFLGERSDVPSVLADLDVFVLPSRFEGLCLAVIEAQAAGVPVIATPVGGIQETVIPGETGTLVPVDDAAAVTRAILTTLADPQRARVLAAEARRRVNERFAVGRMVAETIALYRR